jgi:hypothetical protein
MARLRNVRQAVVPSVGFALAVGLAITVAGCGNSGEGTVKVDPKVAARLGKRLGVPPAAYGKNMLVPVGIKGRQRKNATAK